MDEIRPLSSRIVYRNRWMTLREDTIERPDGSRGIYSVVEKPDFAVVAALQDGQVHLVEQYRYPVGARFWELPQGTSDQAADALDLARTELREETGIVAGTMRHVARLHEAYGYSTQAFDLFVATDLAFGPQELEDEEQGLVCRAFAVDEAIGMINRGVITDAVTVAAFGLLRLRGIL